MRWLYWNLNLRIMEPHDRNPLFPVFLKIGQLHTLVVGGGHVGLEKLGALLKNDPAARVTVVSPEMHPTLRLLAKGHPGVHLVDRRFRPEDLEAKDLVLLATDYRQVNEEIYLLCKARGLLVNVADTPELCDFYLGSTVTKGSLKIGISTNGKSPTLARRVREVMEDTFPDSTVELLGNLGEIRKTLTGDFRQKLEQLNAITSVLAGKK
jgi:siroheme synthase-like protein